MAAFGELLSVCLMNRGEHIIPSARKSIHSHTCCPFAASESTTGRYGMKERNEQKKEKPTPSNDLGKDEVDNVLSKYVRNASERQHSSDSENCDISDDNCDDFRTEESDSHYFNEHSHYQSLESSNCHSNISNNKSLHELNNGDNAEFLGKKRTVIYLTILIVIVGIPVSYWIPYMQDKDVSSSKNNYDENIFLKDMSAIGKIYNLNEDSVLQLHVGITSISEKQDTDSFIFVYNSENDNFNLTVLNEFINEVASVSARYLRKGNASVRHIVVDTSSLMVKNTDELIHKYSDDITNGGVMVMRKLDMLPSSLAMALHYYCDVYNPLVKKSAMFFTLDIANCSGKMSTHSDIEECLGEKWSTVSSEFIGPLLSRVVSVVVDVTNIF